MTTATAILCLGGGWISGVFTVLVFLREPPQEGETRGKRSVPPW